MARESSPRQTIPLGRSFQEDARGQSHQKKRAKIMRAVKGRDTRPELCVRRAVYSLGYRYRIGDPRLAGRPDLVFRSRKKVIFVHGCFWHVHRGCPLSHIPKALFWRTKLKRNTERDRNTLQALQRSGWECLIVWECELRRMKSVCRRILAFLGPPLR
jgi:DNA mismatch endonuclease, patch repair protein